MRKNSLMILLLIALTALACAANAADSTLTWPQQFSLYAGDKAEYTIPVTAAGDIVVDVTWQGVNLIVALIDPSGKPVGNPAQQGSPAKISYIVTSADLQKGTFWKVVVGSPLAPRPSPQPIATGQVTVQSPKANLQLVTSLQNTVRQRMRSKVSTPKPDTQGGTQGTSGVSTRMNKSESNRLSANAALLTKLQAQMQTNIQQYNTQLSNITKMSSSTSRTSSTIAGGVQGVSGPSSAVKNARLTPRSGTLRDPAAPTTPGLSDVNPTAGVPGDVVVVNGWNTPADKSQIEAWFTINSGVTVPATILDATEDKSQGIVGYQVQVPGKAGITQGHDGVVYMKLKNQSSPTNTLSFRWDPAPPTITATDPLIGEPGLSIRFDGANFKQSDEVHFIMPGGNDVTANKQVLNATQMMVTIPDYSAKQQVNAQVYMRWNANKTWTNGTARVLPLKPTQPSISGFDRVEGEPVQAVLVSGAGFRQPLEVHFIWSGGKDDCGNILSSGDTQILVEIPDFSGIASPFNGQIYVKSVGQSSDLKAFRFIPATEYKTLDINEYDTNKVAKFIQGDGDDNVGFGPEIKGVHFGSGFTGHKNEDEYFMNVRLQNNWVVDYIEFRDSHDPGEADSGIWESHEGTDSPYVKVHWWDTPMYDWLDYYLTVHVRGPRGTSYK